MLEKIHLSLILLSKIIIFTYYFNTISTYGKTKND